MNPSSQLDTIQTILDRLNARIEAVKTYDEYRSRLWRACERLFNGGKERNFPGSFARSIDQQLTQAWNTGADSVGFTPGDMNSDDVAVLGDIISSETDYIDGMATSIADARDSGMDAEAFGTQFGARCDIWANRFNDVVNQARIYFGGVQKLEWIEGETSDKCDDCVRLNGTVARAQDWADSGWKPQSPDLACHGFNCLCQLTPTDKPITKGGIPN